MELPDSALPGLFLAADEASLTAQRRFLTASRLRLCLLIVAAVAGTVSVQVERGIEVAAIGTAVALVGAVLVEVFLLTERPERTWYDGRALAESAKSLAWRFAVGGAPFSASVDPMTAEIQLVEQLAALLRDGPSSTIYPSSRPAVTAPMRALRAADFERRRQVYIRERIEGQSIWYEAKAQLNRSGARRWRVTLLVIESVGVLAALLRAVGLVMIDLAGIAAAIAAAGVAWLSLKQHESLARAYAYASNELAIASTRLRVVAEESEWTAEVDNAEGAISREHTMWRASRSTI